MTEVRSRPLSEVLEPRNGYVVVQDRWWVVSDDRVFFSGHYPLAHRDKSVLQKQHPGRELKKIPVAYLPNPYFGYIGYDYK